MLKGKLKAVVIGLLILVIAITLWQSQSIDANALIARIEAFGPWAWLVFMMIYAAGTVLFFPGSILTLAGGAIFGPLLGTFLNLTSATLGAAIAFLLARHLGADWVENRVGGRLKQIKQGVENEGWRFVAFVRLVPLFPFNLLNYALGLTQLKFAHYLLASYVCMLPGALAYTYLGYAGREAVAGSEDMIEKGLVAMALLAAVAFLPRLIRQIRGEKYTGSEQQNNKDDSDSD